MNPQGEIRELTLDEAAKIDEILLSKEEAEILKKLPKSERMGYYKKRKLAEEYRNDALKLRPRSLKRKRKQPKSVLPKSLRRKR